MKRCLEDVFLNGLSITEALEIHKEVVKHILQVHFFYFLWMLMHFSFKIMVFNFNFNWV